MSVIVREGRVDIVVPSGGKIKKSDEVFYNPVMKFNRDLSVLVLNAFSDVFGGTGLVVVDGLSASGVRGLRYLKECDGVSKVIFNDLNPSAVRLIKKNIMLNKVHGAEVVSKDLNALLHTLLYKTDVVDIDPFGSPVYFLDAASRALSNNSLLCLTATDTAALSGSSVRACLRKYDAKPFRVDMMHEIGLRILIGSAVRRLAVFEKGFFPLVSFSKLHYYRICGRVLSGTLKSDKALESIGYLVYCSECGFREFVKDRKLLECPQCRKRLSFAGPLWIGELGDSSFVDKMKSFCKDSGELKFLDVLLKEYKINYPMVDIHKFCKMNRICFGRIDDMISDLLGAGFVASRTHICPTALRTDADYGFLKKVMSKKRR